MKKVTLILVIVWGMAAYLSENVFSISVVVLWATIICAIPVFLFLKFIIGSKEKNKFQIHI